MALSVKAAGEFVEVLADGGEGAAAQIDVVGEDGIDGRNGRCVVDLVGQPCLAFLCYLIDTERVSPMNS